MASQPPLKRRKLDPYEEFEITVGSGEATRVVTVAKNYLTKSSEFFKKACNGVWQKA
ncbi:hypothetical protein CLAFUW4_06654 [Fulvia fulva]|uniref:BTB domain-containing protein n=1 Tax=Passalora fulva TaxID=5499 RepID=A0A9Q8PAY9_PASFU|nr:uncharacterized protein CLAFUR5_06798 [Fulvia fulva]KAK4621910.1 hypothetical protein CLAFUR4_06662 [Fulvia fulva]KAK4622913.1 hypothetical protein CLAFUR0_06656 [Fulvia fulva]UJO19158.1 hypothetical protein CLAFUR5_06798 [Fulvia fulva]WPV15802.1 hypothetical protein CLAFUW4_06654 [Fulvia fulva]WPV31719.1 hypothetical protein CLAFUW7_06653 [Fulvia fulva]